MKKITYLFGLLLLCLSSITLSAQNAAVADFYAGKWDVTIFGTPQGDAKMTLTLNRKEGKLTGDVTSAIDTTAIPLTSIEEADGKVTIYFSMMGYDLNIPFEKEDADNIKGQLMGMFETKAKRVK